MPIGPARLYFREIGNGRPVVILHGGPDFDQSYLIPEMDRLAESLRLIYYDQRGRGRSAYEVPAEDVDIRSEVEDMEQLRCHFGLESMAVLGHSWGGLLAMEYAVRHPDRLSHLILMNTAPASHQGFLALRAHLRGRRTAAELRRMEELRTSEEFQSGDFEVEADYYRIHYRAGLVRSELIDRVVGRLRSNFTTESLLNARTIEDRLYDETWQSADYDLTPALRHLTVPTLIIHGDADMVPTDVAAEIAGAIPTSRLVILEGCGHFAYLERPEEVYRLVVDFINRGSGNERHTSAR